MSNPPSTPRRHESYTVAVICALGFEMSAVRYMLDCEHPRLRSTQGDSNMYVLGELSGHNIVLACLPGSQGKGAAVAVATNIARTFPCIRWRLLVGIGGGVPSEKNDIRLGDVVISMPDGQHGGVVQYDLGKDHEESFQLKGFLWPPPEKLRSAVELMRSDHFVAENKVEEFLLQMLQKGPRLSVYKRPPTGHDLLFHTDYPHVGSGSKCENCDGTKTIIRSPRQHTTSEVHYGLIASGDRVMRSAAKRNAIIRSVGDLLCFEMEAAGIATEFPCIVIRGVSDYADSHKNDIWQHYAAAAAAASAKELLSYIDPETNPEQPSADTTPALPRRSAQPGGNEGIYQTLPGQGIQSSGTFSVGRDIHIGGVYNQMTPTSDPEYDLWREFLKDLCESDPNTDMSRIADDKGGLLPKCFNWVFDNKEFRDWREHEKSRLLWVKGDPGKGKTMLMIGLVRYLQDTLGQNCALAFFFCQSADKRLNNDVSVLRGLVWMLLRKNLSLSTYIPEEYRSKSKEMRTAMLKSQNPNIFPAIKLMLDNMLRKASYDTIYLLVDALDECGQDSDRLVRLIIQYTDNPQPKIKWLVSSRYSLKLDRTLHPNQYRQKLDLELNDKQIAFAVAEFIKLKVEVLASEGQYNKELQTKIQKKLEDKAESTFLWVALICQHLQGVRRGTVEAEVDKFPPGLPALYDRMMDILEGQNDDTVICKQILCIVTLAYRPLTLIELIPLADLPTEKTDDVRELINLCSSFLILRGDTVRFLHQSTKDYLEKNYESRLDPAGLAQGHANISTRSIAAMSSRLKQNMHNLKYGFKQEDMVVPQPGPLAPIRYSCVFWADHLTVSSANQGCKRALANDGEVFTFLKEKFLHWLESLSLIGKLPEGIHAIGKLLAIIRRSNAIPQLAKFLEDAERFIQSNGSIIERAPLQIYGSALIFSPLASDVKVTQWKLRLPFIQNVAGIRARWDIHRQTLEGHGDRVNSVAFSPDGQSLASASDDTTIRLWDMATGSHRHTLEGHGNWVGSVAFSPNGQTLASVSDNKTIGLWDVAMGSYRYTLEGHGDRVSSVAFSPDSQTLASASNDKTIRLWDTATGSHRHTLEGHGDWVSSVAFSPDGQTLASASKDKTIRLWDIATGSHRHTLEDCRAGIWSVAFSPDGRTLASASSDNTVRLWDIETGSHRHILESQKGAGIWSVAFSPDGQTLALASGDNTIRLWDAATGSHRHTLEGHGERVSSVAFSPDGQTLASASNDKTIRLWYTATGSHWHTFGSHGGLVRSVAFSPDGQTLASASKDKIIRLWDTATGSHRHTLEGHGDWVSSVAFSPDGQTLASASDDKTIRLWDIETGSHWRTLRGHGGWVRSVAFSPDGQILMSASSDETIRLWDMGTESHRHTLEGYGGWVGSVAFSPDGQTLASTSKDKTIRLWDIATGSHRHTLEGHGDWVSSVAFSPDGQTLASASSDMTIWLWDTETGSHQHTLEGHGGGVSSVAFSPDGQTIASASNDKTIRLWDTATGSHRHTLEGHGGLVSTVAFSPDGRYLKTDYGLLRLSKIALPERNSGESSSDYALYVDNEWITLDGERSLWLPKDYRPDRVCVYRNTMVLVHNSSRMTFIEIKSR